MVIRKREIFFQTAIFIALFSASVTKYAYIQRKIVYNDLNKEVMENVYSFPGEVGLYIKDLKTGAVITYNEDKKFASASLVKLPIMVATYQAVEDGNITLKEQLILTRSLRAAGSGTLKSCRRGSKFCIYDLIYHMITESDNTATNMISNKLGYGYINWVFKNKLNLQVTRMDRGIMDLKMRRYGVENYTTAREMGDILEKMYNKQLVSEKASEEMLTILQQQKHKDRIRRFLPKDLNVANKTGLLRDICHDAGIVFTDKGDFIVCVLTSDFGSYKLAKNLIGEVAYKTYRCY
ncbi:MAG: serine hydrolase [Elusimicrobiota bacterium]